MENRISHEASGSLSRNEAKVQIANRMGIAIDLQQAANETEAYELAVHQAAGELIAAEPGLSEADASIRARREMLAASLAKIFNKVAQGTIKGEEK